jgi:hypothetical protein
MTVEVAITIAGLAFSGMAAALAFAVRASYAAGGAKEKIDGLSVKHGELATEQRPKVTALQVEHAQLREALATVRAEVRALEKRLDRSGDAE